MTVQINSPRRINAYVVGTLVAHTAAYAVGMQIGRALYRRALSRAV